LNKVIALTTSLGWRDHKKKDSGVL